MKAELFIYRILSFLLLPVAAFFGLICFSGLLLAMNYPVVLIVVFLIACMVIYIIASFIFLTKGIDNNKRCRPVLKDWIRINGFISLVYYLLTAISSIAIKADPSLLKKSLKQWTGSLILPPNVSAADMQASMVSTVNLFLTLSIAFLIHVLITFHLMKRYRYVFEMETTGTEQ